MPPSKNTSRRVLSGRSAHMGCAAIDPPIHPQTNQPRMIAAARSLIGSAFTIQSTYRNGLPRGRPSVLRAGRYSGPWLNSLPIARGTDTYGPGQRSERQPPYPATYGLSPDFVQSSVYASHAAAARPPLPHINHFGLNFPGPKKEGRGRTLHTSPGVPSPARPLHGERGSSGAGRGERAMRGSGRCPMENRAVSGV